VGSTIRNHFFLLLGIALLYSANLAKIEIVSMISFFVGSFLVFISHHSFFHKLMSESMLDIFVTTDRVIYFDDSLFMMDDEHEVPLEKIASVRVQQHGLLHNILDYGILWFDTGGGAIDMMRSIPNVPHPDYVAEIIAKVLKDRRQQKNPEHDNSINSDNYDY